MALHDILKQMPSMGYDFSELEPSPELDFINFNQNNRVLAVPPYKNVSCTTIKPFDVKLFTIVFTISAKWKSR